MTGHGGKSIYRLSDNQARVLRTASLDARSSAAGIAKLAKVKSTTAAHTLAELASLGIVSPFVLINIHKLGLFDFCLFLSLEPKRRDSREQLLNFLARTPQAVYVAELAGEFQYTISYISRSISEVDRFLLAIAKFADGKVLEKAIAMRTDWYIFPPKWGSNCRTRMRYLHRSASEPVIEVKGMEILKTLVDNPWSPLSEISRRLGLPSTTLAHKLKQFETSGLIVGYPMHIDSGRLGFHSFRLLIYENQTNETLRDELLKFAELHPAVVHFVHCVGNWDYELNLEVAQAAAIPPIIQEIYERFGHSIRSVKVVTQLDVHKNRAFPY